MELRHINNIQRLDLILLTSEAGRTPDNLRQLTERANMQAPPQRNFETRTSQLRIRRADHSHTASARSIQSSLNPSIFLTSTLLSIHLSLISHSHSHRATQLSSIHSSSRSFCTHASNVQVLDKKAINNGHASWHAITSSTKYEPYSVFRLQ